MKKVGIIGLVMLYALAVIGINLSIHYCGDTIDSVSLAAEDKSCCCGDTEEDGCCTDMVIKAKLSDTHTPAEKQKIKLPTVSFITHSTVCSCIIPALRAYTPANKTVVPPPLGSPLYLLNSNFRI